MQQKAARQFLRQDSEEGLGMTVKELQKLERQDLLLLLVEQSREAKQLKEEQEAKKIELLRVEESNIRLQAKVSEKDAQIERLTGRLNGKKERIKELEEQIEAWHSNRQAGMENARNVAEAALRLNGIAEAAQKAADQYLFNIRQRCERQVAAIDGQPDVESIGGSEG